MLQTTRGGGGGGIGEAAVADGGDLQDPVGAGRGPQLRIRVSFEPVSNGSVSRRQTSRGPRYVCLQR